MILFDRSDTVLDGEGPAAANWLPPVPQEILARHGAAILDPTTAAVAPGWPRPRPTVYRTATLLVPTEALIQQGDNEGPTFSDVLADNGIELLSPLDANSGRDDDGCDRHVLVALAAHPTAGKPVAVDAWLALQYLRMAAGSDPKSQLDMDLVARTAIEHLMFSGVQIGGAPWDSNASDNASYVRTIGSGRLPVSTAAVPPGRQSVPTTQRRPVVAVFDSGIGPHAWLGISDRHTDPPAGGIVRVLTDVQNVIGDLSGTLNALHGKVTSLPRLALPDYWDQPVSGNPLVDDIDRCTGHGTFIVGIVRQVAPDADVAVARVLHSDGVAYEGDVLVALDRLVKHVRDAQRTDTPSDMIDVLSLSIGYYDESADTPAPGPPALVDSPQISGYLEDLTRLGVLVVAAAGNDATSRPFYPAALATDDPVDGGGPQVISVGALNPNTSKAMFSNEGAWVRCWATGAGVVSAFPTDVQGAFQGRIVPGLHRATLDPDDFSAGFAVWDGTSFAAPRVAAALAQAMFDAALAGAVPALRTVDKATTAARAHAAWDALRGTAPAATP